MSKTQSHAAVTAAPCGGIFRTHADGCPMFLPISLRKDWSLAYLIPTKGGTNAKNDKGGSCVLAYRRRRCGVGYMAICRDCHQLNPVSLAVLKRESPARFTGWRLPH